MRDSTKPPDEDPYLQVLVGIVAELTAIREELQAYRMAGAESDGETFECRCGASVADEASAREHATSAHNAPADHWDELYA